MPSRRQILITGAAAALTAALPAAASIEAAAAAPRAEMLFTTDEPWGMLVRGHVSKQQFDTAALKLLDHDPDIRENAEEWLFENVHDETGDRIGRVIPSDPEHGYMRLDREDDPELGDVFIRCSATDEGAFPITAIMY